MLRNYFYKNKPVGLSMMADGIYLLQLQVSKSQYILSAYKHPFAPYPAQQNQLPPWEDVQSALQQLRLDSPIKLGLLLTQLSCDYIKLSALDLPLALPANLIQQEVQQHLRKTDSALERYHIDYQSVKDIQQDSMTVVIAMATLSYLKSYLQCFDHANLPLHLVDVDLYALLRMVQFSQTYQQTFQVMDVAIIQQAENLLIIIFKPTHIIYYRKLSISDDLQTVLTQAIHMRIPHPQYSIYICCDDTYKLALTDVMQANHYIHYFLNPFACFEIKDQHSEKLISAPGLLYLSLAGLCLRAIRC